MQKVNLKKLKRQLPHGSIMKIAEEVGLSAYWVGKVLSGKAPYNEKIILSALKIVEQRQKIINKIKSL